MQKGRTVAAAAALLAAVLPAVANDSFAEVGAGGIRFLKRADLSIEEERLTISRSSVEVAYAFSNPTDRGITIDIAFPVPAYEWSPNGVFDFNDFSVTADGTRVAVNKDSRAFVGDHEITEELRSLGVSISDFDGFDTTRWARDHLPPATRERLMELGAFGRPWEETAPRWIVKTTYYWRQTFRAKAITRISHRYTPSVGGEYFRYESRQQHWTNDPVHLPTCEAGWRGDWVPSKPRLEELLFREWMRYILTTANNWKGPIRRFELEVRRESNESIMVCGDIERLEFSEEGVRALVSDYRPAMDLVVAFVYQKP